MGFSEFNDNIDIVIRGKITEWTPDIVREYQTNFPNSEVVVSTWNNQKTDDISCKVDGHGAMYLKCSVVKKA